MSDNISTQLLNDLEKEIHVWFCQPDEVTDATILDGYHSILSTEESDKHDRFHFEKDRHGYLVSHALVRKALSSYCAVEPEEWRFTLNQHGKPEILSDIKCPPIKFNLSHTDGMSVVVTTLNHNCGIDVEHAQRKSNYLAVAERMFAEAEVSVMRNANDKESRDHFVDYWTLREAYVKALGTGLGGSSKAFYFNIAEQGDSRRRADILFVPADKDKSLAWQFTVLKLSTEHVASVAIKDEGAGERVLVSRKITP